MSFIDSVPVNKSFLSNVEWRFKIDRLPSVNFFIQSVNIPSINLGRSDKPSPFVKIPFAGDHIEYGELQVTFKIDEDFQSYLEVFNWMIAIGFPNNFNEHNFQKHDDLYSDGTLIALTNAKNPNLEITFKRMWPTFLSDVQFDATSQPQKEIDVTASFAYQTFSIVKL